MMRFASNILIYPRIWSRQPTAKLLLQPIAYKVLSASIPPDRDIGGLRTFDLVHIGY